MGVFISSVSYRDLSPTEVQVVKPLGAFYLLSVLQPILCLCSHGDRMVTTAPTMLWYTSVIN